jgi:uncharacterized protein (DUF885 family)
MPLRCRFLGLCALSSLLALSPPAVAAPPAKGVAQSTADARLRTLVDQLFAEYPPYYPSGATALGLHEHDGELEDLSPAGIAREVGWIKQWQARLDAVDVKQLSPEARFDAELTRQHLRSLLFERERLQDHRRRPSFYVALCSRSVNAIIKREYAPAPVRARAAVARLQKVPALLAQGRANLDRMSQIAIDITLRDLDGGVRFFRHDVPAAFPTLQDATLKQQLVHSGEAAATALAGFGEFLRRERPHATASFALGPQLLQEKLWADEMIDTPLPTLMRRARDELRRLQDEFNATARRIDPSRTAAEVHLELHKDHPQTAEIIAYTQSRLAVARKFLVDHDIVTVPSPELPQVKETPAFRRATTLASMDSAGPFERSTEAYYYVTLPGPELSAADREDFLRGAYNRPLVDVVSIHEVFPGHYAQSLWVPALSTPRKFCGADANIEGWAHYSEQMMLDAGYGNGDPRVRLAQLQDALLRSARFVAAIALHSQGMTVEQAADFFQNEGLQTRQVAEIEARRGTEDPLYLVYTYGKLEILALREDYKRKLGAAYSLRKFHDDFMRHGYAPLKLMREVMLGD